MKEQVILDIEQAMLADLDNAQMKKLHEVLQYVLWNKNITKIENTTSVPDDFCDQDLLNAFLSAKRVEGCSEKTLKYYKATIGRMIAELKMNVTHITTDDLRQYLADYQMINDCSKANIDNIRRILSSFFAWLEDENYILKSPVRRIHKIPPASFSSCGSCIRYP